MSDERIRVLIVDDSALMRNLIGRIIDSTPGLVVAAKAMNGTFALQKIEAADPDVVLLDIEMPELGGIGFLHERRRRGLKVPVIILSSVAQRGAAVTMQALDLGASDFITKPSGSNSEDIHSVSRQIVELANAYGGRYRAEHPRKRKDAEHLSVPVRPFVFQTEDEPRPAPQVVKPRREPGPIEIIAIGISTGGPNALRDMFARLDPTLSVPILVVQHMPAGFTLEFARSLDRVCPLDVKEAEDGDVVKPGRILIAPGDRHIVVERRPLATVVRLLVTPPENGHRPSVDVLFESVASNYGHRALAVIMTGMGKDGARRIADIYEEGGYTVGQDAATCVVYGMPRVAQQLGVLRRVVALPDMASAIKQIVDECKN